MIDEKKIEEAAHDYVGMICENEKYKIFWLVLRAFKFAIDWFLDNIWHDVSEEPNANEYILLETETSKGKSTFVRIIVFDWKFTIKNYHITRWLYIKDLMKGGK